MTLPIESPATAGKAGEAPSPDATQQPTEGLGRLAARGGAYLAARECVGMVIRLAGTVVVLRIIGPSSYGVYSAAAAFVLVVSVTAQMGAEIYLIRQPTEPTDRTYAEVFTFLACWSTALTLAAFGLTFLIGSDLHPAGLLLPLRVLLFTIPVNVLWAPCQAKIERRFAYRKMGLLEVGGDIVLYGVAVPLALLGHGAWSLVAGYFAWQTFLLGGAIAFSGLRPSWAWSSTRNRELVHYGLTYSASSWLVSIGGLANPLIVGRFAGASGVGYVAFAQRLVSTIGFAARSSYRLGIAALSRLNPNETSRLRRAIERGAMLQLIALAVPFAAFGLVARFLVPEIFGATWSKALPLYTMLALASVLNAAGLIQSSVLLSRGQNLRLAWISAIQSAVLLAVAAVLVPHLGMDGFGIASLVALVDLIATHRAVRRICPFSYRDVALAAITLVPPVFAPFLPLPFVVLTLAPLALALAVPKSRSELVGAARFAKSLLIGAPA